VYHYGNERRGRAAMVDLGGNESVRRAVLRELAEQLENWMRVLGYPRKDLCAVQLALEEATVNAFRHGNQGDPAKVVRVNYVVTLTGPRGTGPKKISNRCAPPGPDGNEPCEGRRDYGGPRGPACHPLPGAKLLCSCTTSSTSPPP
jgi:hypothetical protein